MIDSFGIMQGRLLPKYKGRYQAHPLGYWQKEFAIASELGLASIEFILDYNDHDANPLMTKSGLIEINELVQKTGVQVRSVCADYFMEAPLHSESENKALQSSLVLKNLLVNGIQLGITDIVLPCVDQSSLKNNDDKARFVKAITPLLEYATQYNINLSLETDLPPQPFLELLNMFDSDKIKVNYDTGNSASLGYDPMEEFSAYGSRISDIHIKDRKLNGGSVLLGSGNADFISFFKALSKLEYDGLFILQAYRDEEGINVFKEQFQWFKKSVKNEFNRDYTS